MSWNKISKTELEPYLWVYCTEILHHVLNMFYMSQWYPSLASYIRSCFIILTTTFCTKLSLCLLFKIFCFLFKSLVFTNFYARRTSSCSPHQKKKSEVRRTGIMFIALLISLLLYLLKQTQTDHLHNRDTCFTIWIEVLAVTEHQPYLLTPKNVTRWQKRTLPTLWELVPGKLINR